MTIKSIEFLEAVAKVNIPKKQRNQRFKATDKNIRTAIMSQLDRMKTEGDAANINTSAVDKMINSYQNNQVTNEQLAEALMNSVIKIFVDMAADNVKDMGLTTAETKVVLLAAEAALKEVFKIAIDNNEDLNTMDDDKVMLMVLEELHKNEDVLKPAGITVNEFIYGARVKRGVGYDHILDFTPAQLQRYMTRPTL